MSQLATFIINHWELFLALVVILTLLTMNFLRTSSLGFKEIKPVEVVRLMNHENAVVLDVRDDKEFSAGHILNAINIPVGVMEGRLTELEQYRSKPIIISCRTGQQSVRAGIIMRKQGYKDVYKLSGGMMAWQSANMPVTKS